MRRQGWAVAGLGPLGLDRDLRVREKGNEKSKGQDGQFTCPVLPVSALKPLNANGRWMEWYTGQRTLERWYTSANEFFSGTQIRTIFFNGTQVQDSQITAIHQSMVVAPSVSTRTHDFPWENSLCGPRRNEAPFYGSEMFGLPSLTMFLFCIPSMALP